MRSLRWYTGLSVPSESMGIEILKHELFPLISKPLSPTVIIGIAKAFLCHRPHPNLYVRDI